MMKWKDHKVIAAAIDEYLLKALESPARCSCDMGCAENIVHMLCIHLKLDNPRFNSAKVYCCL